MTGITAINNPLGTYGFGYGGSYGSYDSYMPSMLSMGGYGMGMNNPMYGMGTMNGMMGMYNPAFMASMATAQQQIEASQLQHSSNMHALLTNNEVHAYKTIDSAIIRKALTNGDIHQGVQNLYTKVKEGDQEGICKEFDKLKNYVLNTYSKEFKAQGTNINPNVSATQIIEAVYGNIISTQNGGETADLRSDIMRYGETSFTNGFNQGFKKGHQGKYVDETMNHCFGLDINQRDSKDMTQNVGIGIGRTASVLEKGVYGAVAGGTLWSAGNGITALCRKGTKFNLKAAGLAGLVTAGLAMAGDIWWQCTKS